MVTAGGMCHTLVGAVKEKFSKNNGGCGGELRVRRVNTEPTTSEVLNKKSSLPLEKRKIGMGEKQIVQVRPGPKSADARFAGHRCGKTLHQKWRWPDAEG